LQVTNTCNHSILTASDVSGSLLWSDGSTASSPRIVTNTGNYRVSQAINNCMSQFSNVVNATRSLSRPNNILGQDTILCPGESLILDPGSYSKYLWQDNSTAETFTVNNGGTYSITVTDNDNCTFSDTLNVTTQVNCTNVYFPSAFSPNGDGINETFGALGNLRDISSYSLRVFDKYGEIIFTTTDPYKKWSGTYKGVMCNTADYVWEAKYIYKGSQKIIQKGSIVLLR